MRKKLTITLDERLYEELHSFVGRRRISRFIEALVRPHVIGQALDEAYREMAREEGREAEASEWADGISGDVGNEAIPVGCRRASAKTHRDRRRG